MYYYRIYGLNIKSDYEFKEAVPLQQDASEPVDVNIEKGEISPLLTTETEQEKQQEIQCVHRYEEQRGWIRVRGQGCFLIEQGRKITYQLKEGYEVLLVNQIFLCLVLPVAMIQRGMLVFHGSGVLLENRAVVISGISGAGKSTLTSELLNHSGIFMADDAVAIKLKQGRVLAQGAYPQQKICTDSLKIQDKERGVITLLPPDGGREKYAVYLNKGYCMEETPLYAIFVLQTSGVDDVEVEEITGSEKIKYLTDNLYKRGIYLEVGMPAEVFQQCIQVANQVKMYRLIRPKDRMTTKEQVEKIRMILGVENALL